MNSRNATRALLIGAVLASSLSLAEEGVVRGEVEIQLTDVNGGRSVKKNRASVVVYIPDFDQPPPVAHARFIQRQRVFIPTVLAIVKGQTVDFVNQDPLVHDVFSSSGAAKDGNQPLDLHQSTQQPLVSHTFDKTGVVDLYCNIHESMYGSLLVLPNPAFAVTGPDGQFVLQHVPVGKHTIYVWSRFGKANAPVTVAASGTPALVLHLAEQERVQAHKRRDGKDYPDASDSYH